MIYGNYLLPQNWWPMQRENWGSARHDNECVLRPEQVTFQEKEPDNYTLNIVTEKLKAPIYGRDFEGNPVLRNWTSGMISSIFTIERGIKIETEFVISGIPQWPAIWIFFAGGNEKYFEIDIMERFVVNTTRLKQKLWASVWKGTPDNKILHKERSIDSTYRDLVTARFEWSVDGDISIFYNDKQVLSDHDDNIDISIYRPTLIISSAYCGRAFPYCTRKKMDFHVTKFDILSL